MPDVIKLPPGTFPVAVVFEGGQRGLKVSGADGTSALAYAIQGGAKGLNISSFGNQDATQNSSLQNSSLAPTPDTFHSESSVAYQPRSSSLFYTVAMLLGTLGFVGLRRVEPVLLVVLCLCLAPVAFSSCSATITVQGSDTMLFEGNVTSRIMVTCPGAGTPLMETTSTYTLVECPFGSLYSRAWASPSNAPGCAALAPLNVTVQKQASASFLGAIQINSLPKITRDYNYSLSAALAQGVPLQNPTLFPGVNVVSGGPIVDLLLQNIDVDTYSNVAAVPVIIKNGADICKFGYLCQEGSCRNMYTSLQSALVCVEYGFEAMAPTPCTDRGNGTGANCGRNCTSLTCTTMCPAGDCSMSRECLATDSNAYPCQQCQCPQQCGVFNDAMSLSPKLLVLALTAVSLVTLA